MNYFTTFFEVDFFATVFLAAGFFVATAFFVVVFLAVVFLAAGFFVATAFFVVVLAAGFFSTSVFLVTLTTGFSTSKGKTFTIVLRYFLPSNLCLCDFEKVTTPSISACIEKSFAI